LIHFICGIIVLALFATHPIMLLPFAIVVILLFFEPDIFSKITSCLEAANFGPLKEEDDLPDEECFCDPGEFYREQLERMKKPDSEIDNETKKLREKICKMIDKNMEESDKEISEDTAKFIDRYC